MGCACVGGVGGGGGDMERRPPAIVAVRLTDRAAVRGLVLLDKRDALVGRAQVHQPHGWGRQRLELAPRR